MMRQNYRAVYALQALAASATQHKVRKAATVQQQHGLLAICQTLLHLLDQLA
jgi:hypothetical protein